MFNKLLSVLRGNPNVQPVAAPAAHSPDDTTTIFESLAMTDELREALFPKSAQMISAIFDRPAPLQRPASFQVSRPGGHQDPLFM